MDAASQNPESTITDARFGRLLCARRGSAFRAFVCGLFGAAVLAAAYIPGAARAGAQIPGFAFVSVAFFAAAAWQLRHALTRTEFFETGLRQHTVLGVREIDYLDVVQMRVYRRGERLRFLHMGATLELRLWRRDASRWSRLRVSARTRGGVGLRSFGRCETGPDPLNRIVLEIARVAAVARSNEVIAGQPYQWFDGALISKEGLASGAFTRGAVCVAWHDLAGLNRSPAGVTMVTNSGAEHRLSRNGRVENYDLGAALVQRMMDMRRAQQEAA